MSNTGKPKKPVKPVAPKAGKPKLNTSTAGNKPKAPSKPKDEAIEVTAKEVEVVDMSGDKPSLSLKDIINSDENIRKVVDELQAQAQTVNRDTIKAKLLDFNEMGKLSTEEYQKAKALLE